MNRYISRLPSLIAMRAFVVVGQTRSMRRAGEVLHTDHASISRHVSKLEAVIGAPLLEKGPQGLHLTPLGEKFHKKLRRGFDLICDACEEAIAARPRILALEVTPGLAHEVLLPAIPRLASALPAWKINLQTTNSDKMDWSGEDAVHVHLRFGRSTDLPPQLTQVAIHEPRLFPVASPAFLACYPEITTLEEMLCLPFINSGSTGIWENWSQQVGLEDPQLPNVIYMPNTHLALQAAALGQGVALGNSVLANGAIARGELVEVLNTNIFLDSYYMVCTHGALEQSPVRELHDWIMTELAQRPAASRRQTDQTDQPGSAG